MGGVVSSGRVCRNVGIGVRFVHKFNERMRKPKEPILGSHVDTGLGVIAAAIFGDSWLRKDAIAKLACRIVDLNHTTLKIRRAKLGVIARSTSRNPSAICAVLYAACLADAESKSSA